MHFSSLYWKEVRGLGGKKDNLEKLSFLSSRLSHVSPRGPKGHMFRSCCTLRATAVAAQDRSSGNAHLHCRSSCFIKT